MEGNYRPTHSANSTSYSSAPADMDGANTAPFTISYDQANINSPQVPQQSYSQAGNFTYNPGYTPASFSPAPVGPQLSYATSDAGYGSGSNVNMGSRVADAVRNIDTDRIAGNIESGIGYVTDKAGKFTTAAKDKLANPNRRKALAIMGGAVASLALAMSLGNAVLNKTNNSSYDQTPAATSNDSSVKPGQIVKTKNSDPNMNTETADSEHDGKISYEAYKIQYPSNYYRDNHSLDHEGEVSVQYSEEDSVDTRKEITENDLIDEWSNAEDSSGSVDQMLGSDPGKVNEALIACLKNYGGILEENNLRNDNPYNDDIYKGAIISGGISGKAYVKIRYDLSENKDISELRDAREGSIYISVNPRSSDSKRFSVIIMPLYSTYVNKSADPVIYKFDSIPTLKELTKIMVKERNNSHSSNGISDDGFYTSDTVKF